MSWDNFDVVLLRGFLPLILVGASVVRYCAFSFIYLFMFLISPLVCYELQMKKPVQIFLTVLIVLSGTFSLCIPVFHIPVIFYSEYLSNCSVTMTKTLQQVGMTNLKTIQPYRIPRLILPDYVVLITAISLLIYFRRRGNNVNGISNSNKVPDENANNKEVTIHKSIVKSKESNLDENTKRKNLTLNDNEASQQQQQPIGNANQSIPNRQNRQHDSTYHNYLQETFGINRLQKKIWRAWAMQSLFVFINVVVTGAAGIVSPSILNSVYLFSFLGVCTYWASGNKVITSNFAYMRIFLLMYSAIHVCFLYLVQIDFMQSVLPNGGLASRLLGLYYLFDTSCSKKGEFIINNQRWMDFLSPCVIVLLYYLYAIETRRWFDKGQEGLPIVRSLKEEVTLKPATAIDPELQHLIPELDSLGQGVGGTPSVYPYYRRHKKQSSFPTPTIATGFYAANYRTMKPAVPQNLSTSLPLISIPPSSACDNTLSPASSHKQQNKHSQQSTFLDLEASSSNSRDRYLVSPETGDEDVNKFIHQEFGENLTHDHYGPAIPSHPLPPSHTERPLMLSLINTAIRNSYVFTFIAMMAWSVTYKSWMSFILLLSACILWMMPDSRTACLYMSPLIVFYATTLIIIQYIYGFNLSELPQNLTTSSGTKIDLSEIGLQKFEIPIQPLSVMIGFIAIFWLTLRLFMNEHMPKTAKQKSEQSVSDSPLDQDSNADSEAYFGDVDNLLYLRTIQLLNKICEKYWILVCCFAMLVVSIQAPVVVFRIIYMILLIYFQVTFMFSYTFWRKQMYIFWWIVIVYSVIILLVIYTFQFQQIPYLWKNKTGLSEKILLDIGLQQYESAALFKGLLTPVVFLVVIIVQVRYFHKPFLKLSSMSRFQNETSRQMGNNQANLNASTLSTSSSTFSAFIEDINGVIQSVIDKVKCYFDSIYTTFWRLLEVHFTKIVVLLIMYACINEVSAANMVLIITIVIGIPFPRLHAAVVTFSFIWCSIYVLLKMIYQLNTVSLSDWSSNCSGKTNLTDNVNWVGFKKVPDFQTHIFNWAAILVSCSIWHAVRYHQRQYFNNRSNERPPSGVVFGEVKVNTLDDSLLNLLKFFFNYAFYKLGLELCFILTVIVACLRVDVYSVVYLIMLLIFMCTPRKICSSIWWFYLLVLGILLPIQYASCIGLPPGLCLAYPFKIVPSLQQWLFLPNYEQPPVAKKLMADFFQFMFVALQLKVFEIEKNAEGSDYGGGKNRPITSNELPKTFDKDFVSTKDSYLDYLKHAVFYWSYWISLAIVFITGVFWITLFCLGYMILAFIYLWMGQNIMLRKRSNLIASWNVIIYYNYFVILAKCTLQLMGCVYMKYMIGLSFCWIIQLFGVQCINPMSWNILSNSDTQSKCTLVDTGLHWDVTCFFFIILQRKIFMTKSFCHVVLDLNVQNRFASRGAYLINRKMMNTIREQMEKEELVVEKIEKKILKITMRQAAHGKPELNEHYLVMRSGDYHLFEGDPEEDDEEIDNLDTELHSRKTLSLTDDMLKDEFSKSQKISNMRNISELSNTNDNMMYMSSDNKLINQPQNMHQRSFNGEESFIQPVGPKHSLNTIRENSVIGNLELSGRVLPTAPLTIQPDSNFEGKFVLSNSLNAKESPCIIEDPQESSDEDDANPSKLTGHSINPLQLINKVMEQGPRSAIREFKRTQSECRDSGTGNTRRSSVHLGSRLESMSEHDEMSSLPDTAYMTPPPAMISETTTDESYQSAIAGPVMPVATSRSVFSASVPQVNYGNVSTTTIVHDNERVSNITPNTMTTMSTNIDSSNPLLVRNEQDDYNAVGSLTPVKMGIDDIDTIDFMKEETGLDEHYDINNENLHNHISAEEDPKETDNLLLCEEDRKSGKTHSEGCWSKFKASIMVFILFIQSSTDNLILLFNGWTREYRRISRMLDNEKKLVKRKVISKINNELNPQIELESIVLEIVGNRDASVTQSKNQEEERRQQEFRRSRSRFFLLAISIGNVAIVYSEFVCYFLLILNHMLSGNLFSLPYPLMVFLWAMLSVPRPSKNFWIALITYTEVVIVIKYIFQFQFIDFNKDSKARDNNPLSTTYIFGLEKSPYYALLDLFQLLFIFLHRGYLKNNGLWRDHSEFAHDLEQADIERNKDNPRPSFEDANTPTAGRSCNPFYKIKRFYAKMTNPKFNKKVDVYVFMFLCEFISFLIIIFGYVSFGPGTDSADNALGFIKTNKMPVPFVIMLITQFVFFIIDRALFLRKQVLGKFIFQIFHVLLIHAWLFFALPYITKKKFNSQVAPQLLYFVKCIYFALSAYQMKSGYPRRILGNFLTRDFNYLNLVLFKGYMLVPFLYELRNVMDWMWTDTAVALYHWMEVEDVFCKVFVLKCWRRSELEYPTLRGHTRRLASKYTVGILLLSFFFLSFWGPLTLSSFIGTTFVKNPPVKCSFSFSIGGFTPLYTFVARKNNIKQLSTERFLALKECYQDYPSSSDYLQSFEAGDGTIIKMDGNSADSWYISYPSLKTLSRMLNENVSLNLNSQLTCERVLMDVKSSERVVSYTYTRQLSKRESSSIFNAIETKKSVTLNKIFPRFVTAYRRTLSKANALVELKELDGLTYLSVNLTKNESTKATSPIPWWVFKEKRQSNVNCPKINESDNYYDYLLLMMFNERVSDNIFGHLFSNYGILGMYAAYIFVAHRVLRAFYSDISYIIRCEELPHVDRILNLLNEIYLVRESKMFRLEEQLIAKLIFIYRSSETMIKWTRHKKSIVETHMENPTDTRNSNQDLVNRNNNDANTTANAPYHGIILTAS